MPHSPGKQKAIQRLRDQATVANPAFGMCKWCEPQARRPSQRASGTGLSPTMCRPHKEHLARHGHPLKTSYTANIARPLERIAKLWLKRALKAKKQHAVSAVLGMRALILTGKEPGALLPTNTKARAEAVLGRYYAKFCGEREQGIRTRWPKQRTLDALALELAALTLCVELAQVLDPAPASDPHFANTQAGKLLFRRAGGWLRRSEREDHSKAELRERPDGSFQRGPAVYRVELNRFTESKGPVLAHLGCALRESVSGLWDAHGAELIARAKAADIPPIPNWTEKNAPKPKRGGRKPRKGKPPNPSLRAYDRVRKLTRSPL